MGWARGSEIAEDLWKILRLYIAPKNQRSVAKNIIKLFEAHDCDTMEECEDLFKAAGIKFPKD